MRKLRMLSLCSGIGGADFAAEATQAIEVVGQVEKEEFCQAVLAKHWQHVKRMNTVEEVQGDEFGDIDIMVAGIPCQGNSLAGKRKGASDERNLWPPTKRIISKAQPGWVVVENVCGLLTVDAGGLFGTILADLDTLGYRIGWCVYGASEVGAPHQRERVFIVAYHPGQRCGAWGTEPMQGRQANAGSVGLPEMANSHSNRQREWEIQHQRQPRSVGQADAGDDGQEELMAYASSSGRTEFDIATVTGDPGHAAWRNLAPGKSGPVEDSTGRREWIGETSRGAQGAQYHAEQSGAGAVEPGVGRGAYGLPAKLDGHRWPAAPGQEQEAWEPPRTTGKKRTETNA